MKKINIGFIGGCINNQKNIDKEDLYHSVFTRLLSQNSKPFNLQLSFEIYLSYDQLVRKTEQFIINNKLDIIYIFIRPFPLMPLHKPIVKYDKANGKRGLAIHPRLIIRKTKWSQKLTAFQASNEYVFVRRNKIELRDLNLLVGIMIGLHHWALKYIAQQIDSIGNFCNEHKTKLVIISPPKNPESIAGNIICR
jgi:hypothetical protein